jgi:hypothetical protein
VEGLVRYFWESSCRKVIYRAVLYVAAFCIGVQPLSFYASEARAIPGESIIVNEFSANGGDDWAELYNASDAPIAVKGWELRDSTASNIQVLDGTIAAKEFLVVEFSNYLNVNTDTIRLLDAMGRQVATLTYTASGQIPYPGAGQTTARAFDGGDTWVVGVPTKGAANDTTASTVPQGGLPHAAIQVVTDFNFTWQPANDPQGAQVFYELRTSKDEMQVGAAPDSSAAWYSEVLNTPALLASLVPSMDDGLWFWQVRSQDATGNRSAWSSVWCVSVDTIGPVVNITKPAPASVIGGSSVSHVELAATIQEQLLVDFTVTLDGENITSDVTRTQTEAGAQLAATWAVQSLRDGTHTVHVYAKDVAGRSHELSRIFNTDTVGPDLTTPLRQNSVLKGTVPLEIRSEALDLEKLDSELISNMGETVPLFTAENSVEVETASGRIWQWDTTSVQDGTYTVRFTGIDILGNKSVMERTVVVANMIGGGMGGVAKDPLLEQLSTTLSRPFVLPASIPPRTASSFDMPLGGIHLTSAESTPPIIDLQAPLAVAATENGWQVLGVLWYWWVIIVLAAGCFGFYSWRVLRRRQFLDSA